MCIAVAGGGMTEFNTIPKSLLENVPCAFSSSVFGYTDRMSAAGS